MSSLRSPARVCPHFLSVAVIVVLGLIVDTGRQTAHGQDVTRVGAIVGRVVAEGSGQPVSGALVKLTGTAHQVASDSLGEFRIRGLLAGRYTLTVVHLAYGEHSLAVDVAAGVPTELRVIVSHRAIALEPLNVEALSAEELRRRGAGFRRNVVTRAQIERAEGTNMSLPDVLRAYVPQVRIRRLERVAGAPVCIELRSIRSVQGGGCLSPLVYLDGAPVTDPTSLYDTLDPRLIETMEVIPANEAGVRFGPGGLYGALVIETRRPGLAPANRGTDRRDVFDWSQEARGHATPRVMLLTTAANVAGLGVGVLLAKQCLSLRAPSNDGLVSDCPVAPTLLSGAAALALPAVGAGLVSHLAGRTEMSEGRLLPSSVSALMVLVPGYALVMTGKRNGSEGLQNFGYGVLILGAPLMSTASDYLFRKRREELPPPH